MNWKLVVGAVCLASLLGCEKEKPAEEPKSDEAVEEKDGAKKKDEAAKGSDEKDESAKKDDASAKTGEGATKKIEGECVKDIKAHAVARLAKKLDGEFEEDEIKNRLQVRDFGEDLDGDGQPDKEAAFFAYAANQEIVLYLSNSGCAVPVGDFMVTGLSATKEAAKPGAIRGIESWTKGGCAGLEGDLVTYAFDPAKKTYASAKTVSCDCNAEDPKRDPLCPKP